METSMSIKTKIAAIALAALAITSVATTSAFAKPKIGPALVGAAIIGTTIAAATTPSYGYYPHHRHCFLKPQYNLFGGFMGYVKVCRWH
jgi:hypothetical protein